MHPRIRFKFGDEIDGRLTPADMEFVSGCQIVRREIIDVLAGGGETLQQGLFQRAMPVVRDDGVFNSQSLPPWPTTQFCRSPQTDTRLCV